MVAWIAYVCHCMVAKLKLYHLAENSLHLRPIDGNPARDKIELAKERSAEIQLIDDLVDDPQTSLSSIYFDESASARAMESTQTETVPRQIMDEKSHKSKASQFALLWRDARDLLSLSSQALTNLSHPIRFFAHLYLDIADQLGFRNTRNTQDDVAVKSASEVSSKGSAKTDRDLGQHSDSSRYREIKGRLSTQSASSLASSLLEEESSKSSSATKSLHK